jgi:diguanylate cyclase (GGDEF)-like protein
MSQLLDELKRADSLPSPPGIAIEIIRLNRQDEVEIDQLVQVLSRDPAIAAKVLRTANSAAFGRPGRVAELHQAVMLLGLRSVNLLALSFSLLSQSHGKSPGFDYRRYWTLSAVTTVAARLLAEQRSRALRDEAFLAGLLCDFSRLVLAECAPQRYAPVLTRLAAEPAAVLEVVERELLGVDHAALGGELLEQWGLPETIVRAVAAHHDPASLEGEGGRVLELARILELSTACGELLAGGDVASAAERVRALGERHFGMSGAECQAFLEQVEAQLGELSEILALETTDPGELAQIRVNATEFLVKESLALNEQMRAVSSDVKRLEEKNSALEQRATTDPLTQLRNRGFFDEALVSELERAAQSRHALGLLLVDVDHFKGVNDEHGHRVGDQLLQALGGVMRKHAGPNDCAARYGGEELALICSVPDAAALAERAEALRAAIAAITIQTASGPLRRTVSIGGCLVAPGAHVEPSVLVEAADTELYRAKSEGRNRVFVTQLPRRRFGPGA